MTEVLNTISNVLDFCLNVFSMVLEWSLDNPILALGIYIPVASFLIAMVFKLAGSLFNKSKED